MSPGETRDVPYRFPGATGTAVVTAAHGGLAPGESSHVEVTVAGRIMLFRPQGGAAFADLRDWTGSIQLFADQHTTERFDEFIRLGLGDWIGATGEVMRTRRGELSVKVAAWRLLAETRRGFGDKWQGVHDVETRYRQREVDLWANEGVRETFLLRSRVVRSIRQNLDERGFVEVETPILQALAGGANARPFVTHFNSLHADFVLRIASRALPQAPRHRRIRARLRDREGLPQRGAVAKPQPRVHRPRGLPSLRRRRRHDRSRGGSRVSGGDRRRRGWRAPPPGSGRRPQPPVAHAHGRGGDPRGDRRRLPARRRPRRAAKPRRRARSAGRGPLGTGQGPQRDLRAHDRAPAVGPGARDRSPARGLAAHPPTPRQARCRRKGRPR